MDNSWIYTHIENDTYAGVLTAVSAESSEEDKRKMLRELSFTSDDEGKAVIIDRKEINEKHGPDYDLHRFAISTITDGRLNMLEAECYADKNLEMIELADEVKNKIMNSEQDNERSYNMEKKFVPRPIWVAEDVEPNFLFKYQQDGGNLYMIDDLKDNTISVSPNFSTDLDDAKPVRISIDYVTQEVRIKEGHDPLLAPEMKNHIKNGGKLYTLGCQKNGVIFVSSENPVTGHMTNETPAQYILPEDIEFVDVGMTDQDFADAVASIPENGQGMEQ